MSDKDNPLYNIFIKTPKGVLTEEIDSVKNIPYFFNYLKDEKAKDDIKEKAIRDLTSDPTIDDSDFLSQLYNSVEEGLSNKENMIDEDVAVMITEVVHIFDIDQAFINEDLIIEDENHDKFFYTREGIRFVSKNIVEQRNNRKQQRINQLLGLNTINIFGRSFPYSIYFYSVNIDDFHHDDALNWDNETKNAKAAEFERTYFSERSPKGKVKKFLELFKKRNPEDFPCTATDSCNYIMVNNNSLKRCSNVFLIITTKN